MENKDAFNIQEHIEDDLDKEIYNIEDDNTAENDSTAEINKIKIELLREKTKTIVNLKANMKLILEQNNILHTENGIILKELETIRSEYNKLLQENERLNNKIDDKNLIESLNGRLYTENNILQHDINELKNTIEKLNQEKNILQTEINELIEESKILGLVRYKKYKNDELVDLTKKEKKIYKLFIDMEKKYNKLLTKKEKK